MILITLLSLPVLNFIWESGITVMVAGCPCELDLIVVEGVEKEDEEDEAEGGAGGGREEVEEVDDESVADGEQEAKHFSTFSGKFV